MSTVRNLKIKTGVVKRLGKELISYGKEVEQEQARLDKLKDNGADIHDINKQKEVLEESQQMIPDCKRRLNLAYKELTELCELMTKENAEIANSKEMEEAKKVLEENKSRVD